MKTIIKTALFCLCFSCNYMKDMSLYETSSTKSSPNENFSKKNIFIDSKTNSVWGVKAHPCKTISFKSKNNFIGKDHLYIKWAQSAKCNYLGMGFTWDNYKSKNLSPIINHAAIQLRIRVDTGNFTKVPILFVLADYSGRECRTKINYLGIEGGKIDTTWTKVTIPLKSFNYIKKGVNMSNIKELKIEFQRKGSVHLDNIKIVKHQHNYDKSHENFTKKFSTKQINIGVKQEYWWGINTEYSSNLKFISKTKFLSEFESNEKKASKLDSNLSAAIAVTMIPIENEIWNNFGFAFYRWKRVDLSDTYSSSAIQFKIKAKTIPKLKTTLRSYSGKIKAIHKVITENNYSKIKEGYYNVCIPLKSFQNFKQLNWSALKEIRFKLLENSNFEIGDFKIIEFRGNPQKPNQWRGL